MPISETNETVQGKKNDNKAEDRFSHLTTDVCVNVRLRVCVKGLGRNGRRGVIPSSAAGKTNLTERWSWVAKLKYTRREPREKTMFLKRIV